MVSGRSNSDTYIKLLKDTAIPLMRDTLPDGFVLQQDNCSIHVSKKCFEDTGIELLPWYSRSADLNIIENLWSMLSSQDHDGSQPKINQELEERVFEAVNYLNSQFSELNMLRLFSHLCIVVSHLVLRSMEIKFFRDFFWTFQKW